MGQHFVSRLIYLLLTLLLAALLAEHSGSPISYAATQPIMLDNTKIIGTQNPISIQQNQGQTTPPATNSQAAEP